MRKEWIWRKWGLFELIGVYELGRENRDERKDSLEITVFRLF